MNKPKQKTRKYYDYHECAEYISKKYFQGRDLRDFGGKYGKKKVDEKTPYLDFWHWLLGFGDIHHNGCFIYMPPAFDIPNYTKEEKWVAPIVQAFEDEFGEEAEMWVEW